jgi:hypothetical protein
MHWKKWDGRLKICHPRVPGVLSARPGGLSARHSRVPSSGSHSPTCIFLHKLRKLMPIDLDSCIMLFKMLKTNTILDVGVS